MGNRPVMEVTTGLAGEFLGLRYKSGSVVPWALHLTVWSGHRQGSEMVRGSVTGGSMFCVLTFYVICMSFYVHIICIISCFVTYTASEYIIIIIIINILTAIALAPGGSSPVHIYREHYIEYTNNTQNT